MIISHRHRFIFIKTRKTASTSIEAVLARHCGPDDVLTPLVPAVPGHAAQNDRGRWLPARETLDALAHGDGGGLRATLGQWRDGRRFYKHIPARLVRARLPASVWRGYFKFCVERDPVDRSLSHFHMLRARGEVADFDAYLARGDLCWNAPLYTDRAGRVIVDRVLPYEDLDAAFGAVMARLGLPYEGRIGVRAKAGYRPADAGGADPLSLVQRTRLQQALALRDEPGTRRTRPENLPKS